MNQSISARARSDTSHTHAHTIDLIDISRLTIRSSSSSCSLDIAEVLELFALYVPPRATEGEHALGKYILDLKLPIANIGANAGDTIELRYRPSEMTVISLDGIGHGILLELKVLIASAVYREPPRHVGDAGADVLNSSTSTLISSLTSRLLHPITWCASPVY